MHQILSLDRGSTFSWAGVQNLEDICDIFIEVLRWMHYIRRVEAEVPDDWSNPLKYWDPRNDPDVGGDPYKPTGTASWATAEHAGCIQ